MVDGVLERRDRGGVVEEGRRRLPVRSSARAGELEQVDAVEALRPGAGEQTLQLGGHAAGAERRAQRGRPLLRVDAGEELAEDGVLLRRAQQPHRAAELLGVLLGTKKRVAEPVEGHGRAGARRAPQPCGDAGAELLGSLTAEREHQDLLEPDRAALDALGDQLDDRRGLARSGTGQHLQGPALGAHVLEDGGLGVVEADVAPGGGAGRTEAVLDGHGTIPPEESDRSVGRPGRARPRVARPPATALARDPRVRVGPGCPRHASAAGPRSSTGAPSCRRRG